MSLKLKNTILSVFSPYKTRGKDPFARLEIFFAGFCIQLSLLFVVMKTAGMV